MVPVCVDKLGMVLDMVQVWVVWYRYGTGVVQVWCWMVEVCVDTTTYQSIHARFRWNIFEPLVHANLDIISNSLLTRPFAKSYERLSELLNHLARKNLVAQQQI